MGAFVLDVLIVAAIGCGWENTSKDVAPALKRNTTPPALAHLDGTIFLKTPAGQVVIDISRQA